MKLFLLSLLALALISISGCKDETNPIDPGDHFEPEGWLFEGVTEIPVLVVWKGEIENFWNNSPVENRFNVGVNDSIFLRVRFLDSSGNIMADPDDPGYTLGWINNNNLIAELQHHETDRWSFIITGISAGSTSVEMRLLHGGHTDAITPLIPIDVF
jgi:hypothetical protein